MEATTLVGRERQSEQLAALVTAEAGGSAVLIGDAGVGKSTLLAGLRRRSLDAGRRVLAMAGVQTETRLPWAGLHQLLRPLLAVDAWDDALPAVQRTAVRAAFGAAASDEGALDPYLIALAAFSLISDAATVRPVTVLADDVQWLDPESHEALTFLARRCDTEPVVVVGVVRNGHRGPFVSAGFREVAVEALVDEDAAAVLDALRPDLDAPDRQRILQEARGNPLALVELSKAWTTGRDGRAAPSSVLPITARLERSFAGRISGLPQGARDVVLAAAVDGEDALSEILAVASALRGRPVGAGELASVVESGLVHVDEMSVRFWHPLVRSAVLGAEPLGRRHAAHAALAAVLDGDPYRRTWHLAQSVVGPDDEVADLLVGTVPTAVARGAAHAAISSLERAAQLSSDQAVRGHRLLLAAEYAFGLGRAERVESLVRRASALPLSTLDRARTAWLSEIFSDGVPGDPNRVLQMCDIAGEAVAAGEDDLALRLLHGAGLRCWWSDTGPHARARVVAVAHRLPRRRRNPLYLAAVGCAEPVHAAAEVLEELDGLVLEDVNDADDLRLLGQAAYAVGHSPLAADLLGRSEARLRVQGRVGLLSHVLLIQVPVRLALGDWSRAAQAAAEGERLGAETGQPIWHTGALAATAWAAGLRGDVEHALEVAAQVEVAAGERRLNDFLAHVQLSRGAAWASTGNYATAYEELRTLFDPARPCYHPRVSYLGITLFAEAAVHTHRGADAREVLAELFGAERFCPSPDLRVDLAYARAALADDSDAERLYREALSGDLVRRPWMRARTELAYGAWLRRRRRVGESRIHLRSAAATFRVIGAAHWAGQADTELRASGERPTDTVEAAARDLLTPQELQVARLTAQGLSNREIGEHLYLSPRTVGSHLSRIFPKLGVTARAQLAVRTDLS